MINVGFIKLGELGTFLDNAVIKAYDGKVMAKVVGRNLQISAKKSYEVANFIRGKKVDRAVNELQLVVDQKLAIPYRRYGMNTSHKRGIVPGKYPRNVSVAIAVLLSTLKSVEKEKGLNEKNLPIIHAAAHRSSRIMHNGRNRGVRKNMHFELVAKELEDKKKTTVAVKHNDSKVEKKETKSAVSTGDKSQ